MKKKISFLFLRVSIMNRDITTCETYLRRLHFPRYWSLKCPIILEHAIYTWQRTILGTREENKRDWAEDEPTCFVAGSISRRTRCDANLLRPPSIFHRIIIPLFSTRRKCALIRVYFQSFYYYHIHILLHIWFHKCEKFRI